MSMNAAQARTRLQPLGTGFGEPRFWSLQALIAGLWLFVWWLAAMLEIAPHVSLWFPPAGLTYAAFRLLGWRAFPGVAVAALTATVLANTIYDTSLPLGQLLLAGALFAIAHGGSYLLGVLAMDVYAPPILNRSVPKAVTSFFLFAPPAALLAASLGTLSLMAAGLVDVEASGELILPWWIGDFAGIVALGPFFVGLLGWLMRLLGIKPRPLILADAAQQESLRPLREFLGKLLVCLGLIATASLLAWLFPGVNAAAFAILFVLIPQMWIVHSEDQFRAVSSVAMNSLFIAMAIFLLDLDQHALIYQFTMIIMAATAYFGLAIPMLYADNRELRKLLTRDSLTGAATRHHFMELSRLELEKAQRHGRPLALMIIDIDHFKLINDEYGHVTGDQLLTEVTRRCAGELRSCDVLGRIGGDEFLVLLPETGLGRAVHIAERLRSRVGNPPIRASEHSSAVSISLGLVEIRVGDESFDTAFERADRALYQAKRQGRNRVATG